MTVLRKTGLFAMALIALIALAGGASTLRRRFIQTWFRDAGAQGAPALSQPPRASIPRSAPLGPEGFELGQARRVRVVLLDGLGGAMAAGLPLFSSICESGIDLQIDVGFPTVSLPVQAVLWTGLTQQQLGLWYRIKALAQAPVESAPARVPGSVAVAEDQPFIAGSFGFSSVLPAAGAGQWDEAHFRAAAQAAVHTGAPLVFVHVLRIDKAGHKAGAASPAYGQAALWADRLLAELTAAAPPDGDTRWFVLADHGHRARGGHGGAEPDVRVVRACISAAGASGTPAPAGVPGRAQLRGRIHLIDLSRALFDALGLDPSPGAVGRPLEFALAHPDRDATLPGSIAGGLISAIALGLALAAALLIGLTGGRRGRLGLLDGIAPAWLPLALAGIWLTAGPLTLSNPIIYPPWGRDVVIAGLSGLLPLLGLVGWRAARVPGAQGIAGGLRLAASALLPALAAALGCLVGCGGLQALLDPTHGPPLRETVTAHASVLLALVAAAAAGTALVLIVAALAAGATRAVGRRGATGARTDW